MSTDDSFHHNRLDLLPNRVPVGALSLQVLPESQKAPLVSLELSWILVLLEDFIVFIDCVVCEMDELVSEIFLIGVKWLGSKPDKSILVQVQPGDNK